MLNCLVWIRIFADSTSSLPLTRDRPDGFKLGFVARELREMRLSIRFVYERISRTFEAPDELLWPKVKKRRELYKVTICVNMRFYGKGSRDYLEIFLQLLDLASGGPELRHDSGGIVVHLGYFCRTLKMSHDPSWRGPCGSEHGT